MTTTTTTTTVTLTVGSLLSNTDSVRTLSLINDRGTRLLAESIKRVGLLHKPTVRCETIDSQETYFLVEGLRRVLALKTLFGSSYEVECEVITIDSTSVATVVQLESNANSVALSKYCLANATTDLESVGYTVKQIKESLNVSDSHYKNLRAIANMHPTVHEYVKSGKLGLAHAISMQGLVQEKQAIVAKQVVSQELSLVKTKELVRKTKEGLSDNDIVRENKVLETVLSMLVEQLGANIDKSSASSSQIVIKGFSMQALTDLVNAMQTPIDSREEKEKAIDSQEALQAN